MGASCCELHLNIVPSGRKFEFQWVQEQWFSETLGQIEDEVAQVQVDVVQEENVKVKHQEAKRLNVKATVDLHHSLTSWLFLNSMQDELTIHGTLTTVKCSL